MGRLPTNLNRSHWINATETQIMVTHKIPISPLRKIMGDIKHIYNYYFFFNSTPYCQTSVMLHMCHIGTLW